MIKAKPKEARAKKATDNCRKCARWKEVKSQMGIVDILAEAVKKFETKLADAAYQPTVSEFLKLVQIEQEYERELNPPEEIQVRWVETPAESDSSR